MKTFAVVLISAGLTLPISALAEMNDIQYCQALAKTYRADHGAGGSTSPEVAVALDNCVNYTKDAIEILEGTLRARKTPLPQR
jgi:hypothetical protein